MKFLFIADSTEKLKPASDTSLAIVRETLKRKHSVFWATDLGVELSGDQVGVWAAPVKSCLQDDFPTLGDLAWHPINAFHGAWIRKDPPFDTSYVKLCWMLSLAESKVWMLNRPSLLIRYHEKLVPLEARAQGYLSKEEILPSHIGTAKGAREFIERMKPEWVVTKPFLGFGGGGVQKHSLQDFLKLPDSVLADSVVQPFRTEITEVGDRRVFFLQGKYSGDFVRMPKPGGFISNLARGGSAKDEPLTTKEKKVIEKVGKFLKKTGIGFAGADFIGHRVSEINITSPTGVRALEKFDGRNLAEELVMLAEIQIKQRRAG